MSGSLPVCLSYITAGNNANMIGEGTTAEVMPNNEGLNSYMDT
jgi:hypothetical protein